MVSNPTKDVPNFSLFAVDQADQLIRLGEEVYPNIYLDITNELPKHS